MRYSNHGGGYFSLIKKNDRSIECVGIIESALDDKGYILEENSGDKVVRRKYSVGYGIL